MPVPASYLQRDKVIDKTCPILYNRDTNFIQAMSAPAPAGENREPGEERIGNQVRGLDGTAAVSVDAACTK